MKYIESCDNCGSKRWSIYGTTVEAKSLHCIQCICHDCGLIFANPRATEAELKECYAWYYSDCAPEHLDAQWEEKKFDYCRNHIKEIAGCVKNGRLLEIGAGTGVFLKVAKDAGYEVYGVELSGDAVKYAKTKFEIDNIFCGMVEETTFSSEYFDIIYAWHVIEHVPDLDRFLRELYRLLKPHGLLYVGTESYFHLSTVYSRLACFKSGRIPGIVTSSDHTFVFHPASLGDCLRRRGFDVIDVTGYDELSVAQRISWVHSPSWRKRVMMRAVVRSAPIVNRLLGTGPYLKVIAVKRA